MPVTNTTCSRQLRRYPYTAIEPTPSTQVIPALGGLRACAIILVLLSHAGLGNSVPGGFGVTLFFFISGMLITRLLLAEKARTGTISIRKFYARRILRLYPMIVLAVVLDAVVTFAQGQPTAWGRMMAAVFYFMNYYAIHVDLQDGPHFLMTLWSLAIEEQYYIVFPVLALALAASIRLFIGWIAAATVAVLLWRLYLVLHGADTNRIYWGTDTRIDSILYGCLLTLLLARSRSASARTLQWLSRPGVQLVGLMGLVLSFSLRDPFFRDTLRYSLQGLALMPLVALLCFSPARPNCSRFLDAPAFGLVGRLSYSLYLMHPFAFYLADIACASASDASRSNGTLHSIALLLTSIAFAFVFAWCSYHLVELPFLRLRHRFDSSPANSAKMAPQAS